MDSVNSQDQLFQVLCKFADKVDLNMTFILVKLIFIFLILLVVKHFIESLSWYLILRFDRYVVVGTPIEISNYKGIVKDINWSYIVLRTEDGIVRIPISIWKEHIVKVIIDRERKV